MKEKVSLKATNTTIKYIEKCVKNGNNVPHIINDNSLHLTFTAEGKLIDLDVKNWERGSSGNCKTQVLIKETSCKFDDFFFKVLNRVLDRLDDYKKKQKSNKLKESEEFLMGL